MPPSAGPPHEGTRGMHPSGTPAFPGHIRVSRAERDQVVETLSEAFAQGCFDELEFERRMQAAMTATTRGDLAPLLADVPGAGKPQAAARAFATRAHHWPATASDRTWGALAHALTLCSGFIGPLIILLAMGKKSEFVRREAAESLNFQLSYMLANVGLALAAIPTFGLAVLGYPALWIAWFVFVVVGSVTAAQGRPYRYPVNLRMVR